MYSFYNRNTTLCSTYVFCGNVQKGIRDTCKILQNIMTFLSGNVYPEHVNALKVNIFQMSKSKPERWKHLTDIHYKAITRLDVSTKPLSQQYHCHSNYNNSKNSIMKM